MIGTTLPAASLPPQAPASDAPAQAQGEATTTAGETRADAASAGKPATARSGERDPRDAGGRRDDSFARLLDPEPAADIVATAPAAPATPEPAAPPTAALPDQLLGLFAVLTPEATPAVPAMQAQAMHGAPADGALPLRALAAALLPVPAQAAPAQAQAAATGTHGPAPSAGRPGHATAADTRGDVPTVALPLPALAAGAAGHATLAGDAFARLVTDAGGAVARDGIQADPLAAAQPLPLHPPASAATAARVPLVPQLALPQPADPRAGYNDDFGKGVLWMTEKSLGHAQLRVTPDHLGPIDVRLQLDGARVHAEFSSAQPDVRHALEASLPRLREMLGQHGLELAQADVGQHHQDTHAPRRDGLTPGGGDRERAELAPAGPLRGRVARGLLDEYA